MKPYLVVPYESGAANVVSRATGEVVGYVLANFHGDWEMFLVEARGVGRGCRRYRAAAAADVWALVQEQTG